MTPLDWVILAAIALSAASGFQRGVVVTALTLLGAAGGALIGLLLDMALSASTSPAAPALLALVGGLLGAGLLGRAGRRLRARWLRPVSRARSRRSARLLRTAPPRLDRLLGAVLSVVIACGVAWLTAGAARTSDASPAAREAVRESLVLGRLRAALPPASPILDRLARWNPYPALVPSDAGSRTPRGIARDPDVRAARASVVRVVGTACGRRSSGSGWVAARGLVVTNAHVVAGQEATRIQLGGRGRRLDAVAVAFDERDDIAILRVSGLDAPALRLASDAAPGTPVALLGFPGNGPYRVRGGRLGAERRVFTRSEPGGTVASRVIRRFESVVRPGNSGGPLVDRDGRIVATVFAAADEQGSRQGYAIPNGPVRRALAGIQGPVGTGSCPSGAPRVGAPDPFALPRSDGPGGARIG